jgi:two-component system, chemotaxis family, sensor kinase CheA
MAPIEGGVQRHEERSVEDDELIAEFLVESIENLDRLDQDFLDLEREPSSREILASIFRTVHTIKGTCGFLGFHKLESVTHVGESLLGRLRDGELTVNGDITSTLLTMVDAVREMLGHIETSRNEGPIAYDGLIAQLTALLNGGTLADAADATPVAETVAVEAVGAIEGDDDTEELSAYNATSDGIDAVVSQVADVAATAAGLTPAGGRSIADSSIRVDVTLLDSLIDLVGELVLARNQLVQVVGTGTEKSNVAGAATSRVSQLTSELQERVMKTRMQPINSVWGKVPRQVRDISNELRKQIRVDMEGQDTELDRTIIEAIKDPMTHLVRNSVDHGIEMPDVRVAAGKPAEGRLLLRAFHEGGKVVIEIVDDGAGIDPAKIKAKAVEKGVISPEAADAMTDAEATHLIFAPGFSTAEQLSNISGRGVGMDVVKTNIERIGGSLDIRSQVGVGTTLLIRIPLTLAIVPALIVTSSGARFAIPQPNLVELVRIKDETVLETLDGSRFYRLRGRLLPALDLNEMLELPRTVAGEGETGARSLAVLQVDGRQFGLLIDRVNDAEEIVVKPLGRYLKGHPVFAGCTIMGDGSVALILDAMSIARRAGVGATQLETVNESASERTESLLLCRSGDVRVAISLSQVARLEHVDPAAIELAGNQTVLKYGRTLLPVVQLGTYVGSGFGGSGLASAGEEGDGKLKMVVTSEASGRQVGLIVDAIEDSVAVPVSTLTMQGGGSRFGVQGTTVVRDVVTDVVDVDAITGSVDPSFFHADAIATKVTEPAFVPA